MTRPIKFRAWGEEEGRMFDVGEIHFDSDSNPFVITDEGFELVVSTLMQYTGLKDSKGVEIYEGDILSVFDIKEPVVGQVIFDGLSWKHGDYNLADCVDYELEVIGNIYENHDLLKGGEAV